MVIYTSLKKVLGTGFTLSFPVTFPVSFLPDSILYDDIENINLTMTMSDNNSASSFVATVPNEYGKHKNDFSIGNEVEIYIDKDINPPTTKRFVGTIESIDFVDKNQVSNTMTLTGRDYTSLLQNVTIPPSVFNNLDAGSIAMSLINANCSGLTVGSVATTGYVVNHISYNHSPVYDGVMQLAGYVDYMFYVDTSKNVNFQPKGQIINSFTIGSDNVTTAKFFNTNMKMFNQVWVYGDRVLSTAPVETFTSDGIGSVMTLAYKPHNVEVRASGTTVGKGAIFNMNSSVTSGTNYMIDYDKQQIIWVSGASLGNNIPGSGTISTVYYDRSLPIIKYAQENNSVTLYGPFPKIIQDKNIKDPRQAVDIANATLQQSAYPKAQGNIKLQGIAPLMPNTQVPIYLPFHGVSGNYNIFQVNFTLNKVNNLKDEVMTIFVGDKIPDVSDTLKQAILDIRRLQVSDISSTDVITRLENFNETTNCKSHYYLYTQNITGSNMIIGHPLYSWIGSQYLWNGSLAKTLIASGGVW